MTLAALGVALAGVYGLADDAHAPGLIEAL